MQQPMQVLWNDSLLDGANQSYLESQYEIYLREPATLEPEWREFFETLPSRQTAPDVCHSQIRDDLCQMIRSPTPMGATAAPCIDLEHERKQTAVHDLINGYRLFGHLYANIDPLQLRTNKKVPELEPEFYGLTPQDLQLEFDAGDLFGPKRRPLASIMDVLKKVYCGNMSVEFMHMTDSEERHWLQERLEEKRASYKFEKATQFHIMEGLAAAEGLEKYLASKYPGAKRFGLEGCDSLIVALDEIIQRGGEKGLKEAVIGMAHRGRLNVLVNILGKMPSELFDEFEGKHVLSVESGDVKYHQGFSSDLQTSGGNLHLSLAFNPSHLEIVTPVVCGSVRARQERRATDDRSTVLSIAIHGDSAFSGQGVVMESLNMSQTRGYSIFGTIHLIINNQIGFTTHNPQDVRSTLYCSDLAKMIEAPIFHVNADDPEAVYAAARLALSYRTRFKKDVVIDLVGYRRHGHNEADEPLATQPMMYQIIRKHPNAREIYANKLIDDKVFTRAEIDKIVQDYRDSLDARETAVARHLVTDWQSDFATDWSGFSATDWRAPANTTVAPDLLKSLANARDAVPDSFLLHSRVKKIVDDRCKMTRGEIKVDWGYAETLAYATLLNEGFGVRLSGQDCGRGTFFHRHAVWHEQKTGECYVSLNHLNANQANFTVIDSLLSEAAVLGFEYGFSTSEPQTLVIWEAQFGDFANSAQVVIDQFISSGEQKWGRLSGLVMLLPHGYEGQGPEHSSARLERYLQLCAQHNIQVCVPSTPAQVFHMFRRQMIRPMRRPLVVMSPKSLLRHKAAVSSLSELAEGQFQPILKDESQDLDPAGVTRVVLCSGKVYYELDARRRELNKTDTAIVRIEQLYPFPEDELKATLAAFTNAKEIFWCQEEPQNQGAWYSSRHHFQACLNSEQTLYYTGRTAAASPAVGYMNLHQKQQAQLVADAIEAQVNKN